MLAPGWLEPLFYFFIFFSKHPEKSVLGNVFKTDASKVGGVTVTHPSFEASVLKTFAWTLFFHLMNVFFFQGDHLSHFNFE